MLNYVNQERGDTHVLRLQGSLDALTVPDVRPQVDRLIERGPIKVVVDLSSVTTIDSSGVAVVVSLFKRMNALGGGVRVAGVTGQPRAIFEILRLDQSLPVYASVDEALAGF
jgi:anti-sigma B factor antagonist